MADRSLNRHEKAEFYRKLRLVKLRRRQIAEEIGRLVNTAADVQRTIERVPNRMPASDPTIVAWAVGVARGAVREAEEAAGSFGAFWLRRWMPIWTKWNV
ncbi:hypothetical protein ACFQ1S_14525 [Kibdelosporangium lantanae]|uniref:Uncharacterized protein n=1 Tax=Kibdelosporangium lantanae TaxID=1497396 RepID=A0ABW3M7I9_9PSEU